MADHRAAPSPTNRPGANDGRPALALGSASAVATSVLASLFGYGMLPSRLRIHWSLGLGPYYGPEFAPKLVVLAAFPAVVAVVALAGWWGLRRASAGNRFDDVRPYGAVAVGAVLAVLVAVQLGIISANL